ncbi:MerR family transcriptional regulator [Azospirillum sp.]|uniref:MerR family transcriptional regulator n=1 Tax=Azospirillum sp. TaxID=34012 RepID=UPI002D468278|nr:MerR family transcriptional regulator [Azospirillum sp.]HYD68843.1 MerR family transcriptional regulator [Azospirillum sp.]
MRTEGTMKSATAFRTISEVSDDLDVPQHVLRFWETKFPQIRPLKRGGGRRYYRPEDVDLLRRIQSLLYKEGYTIKGVQRLLKESRGALPPAEAPVPANDSGEAEAPLPSLPPPEPDAEPDAGVEEAHESDESDEPPPPTMAEDVRQELEDLLDELRDIQALLSGGKENS